jgi:pimeloyl-ACP methyl ester carboxylesterase
MSTNPGAQLGELQYAITLWQTETKDKDQNSVEVMYGTWMRIFDEMAGRLVKEAEGITNKYLKSTLYLRAVTYSFLAQWPFPPGPSQLEAAARSRKYFKDYLDNTDYSYVQFNATFNNGTASTELPAYFITADPSKKLPLILSVTGTDYYKEMMYQQYGPMSMDQGYSFIVFDGPGQGAVIRETPNMPFYTEEDQVVLSVLDAAKSNPDIADKADFDNVALVGNSLGGYLGGQACSTIPAGVLKACILNPPQTSVGEIYLNSFSLPFIPFVNLVNNGTILGATTVPEKFVPLFQSMETVVDGITKPLLLECTGKRQEEAFQGLAELLGGGGLIDPEFVYTTMKYGGILSDTAKGNIEALPFSLSRLAQFNNPNISQTPVPTMLIKATQDDLLGGQEEAYWDELPPAATDKGKFMVFDEKSGGSLHCQAGSYLTAAAEMYPWLEGIIPPGEVSPPASGPPSPPSSDAVAVEVHEVVVSVTMMVVGALALTI